MHLVSPAQPAELSRLGWLLILNQGVLTIQPANDVDSVRCFPRCSEWIPARGPRCFEYLSHKDTLLCAGRCNGISASRKWAGGAKFSFFAFVGDDFRSQSRDSSMLKSLIPNSVNCAEFFAARYNRSRAG